MLHSVDPATFTCALSYLTIVQLMLQAGQMKRSSNVPKVERITEAEEEEEEELEQEQDQEGKTEEQGEGKEEGEKADKEDRKTEGKIEGEEGKEKTGEKTEEKKVKKTEEKSQENGEERKTEKTNGLKDEARKTDEVDMDSVEPLQQPQQLEDNSGDTSEGLTITEVTGKNNNHGHESS